MIGVCGGRDSTNVKIGDLIIPNEIVTYQNGKLTDKGLIPDYSYVQTNSGIINMLDAKHCNETLTILYEKYQSILRSENHAYLGGAIPMLKTDPMACGDYIIDKKEEIDRIAEATNRRKLCAVEMESYAILRAAFIFPQLKTTVLKAVMDLTTDKSDKYKDYAAFISANFLFDIIVKEKYKI